MSSWNDQYARQLEVAEEFMREYREVLEELAN